MAELGVGRRSVGEERVNRSRVAVEVDSSRLAEGDTGPEVLEEALGSSPVVEVHTGLVVALHKEADLVEGRIADYIDHVEEAAPNRLVAEEDIDPGEEHHTEVADSTDSAAGRHIDHLEEAVGSILAAD